MFRVWWWGILSDMCVWRSVDVLAQGAYPPVDALEVFYALYAYVL